jgi:hypothetical protein
MASLPSSGLPGFDALFDGFYRGDNVVFRVADLSLYQTFCHAVLQESVRCSSSPVQGVYLRFADHPPLLTAQQCEEWHVRTETLTLNDGFEQFITAAHRVIMSYGEEAVLIFDSLSDLGGHYYSDRMIGNFFQLTCPLVLQTGSIAYFSLYRDQHSYHALEPITATTQILVDVYDHHHQVYVRPIKTDGRREELNHTLFRWDSPELFTAMYSSREIGAVLNERPSRGLASASYRMIGPWDRVFLQAEQEVEYTSQESSQESSQHRELIKLIISRDERVVELAQRYIPTRDLLSIWKRTIGTGFIGGKAVGMLLARGILNARSPRWRKHQESHDSFFIASDVYYTFLVRNDCWWERQRQKDPQTFLRGNEDVRERILSGVFPEYIMERFRDMLDYFGTTPVIVRSSSLLEDNFGNAFAGKYDSFFCTMQGSRQERLEEFLYAVRQIYASTISDEALRYRAHRGILEQDEQMALLVQRVSGSPATDSPGGSQRPGRWFMPHLAGVAFSYNPYPWHPEIDPLSGLVRLVCGLGTRAVDRADDDYTRVVALNVPARRPESSREEQRRYAQRRVDVLDLAEQKHRSIYVVDLLREHHSLPISRIAEQDRDLARQRSHDPGAAWVLSFDPLLRDQEFVETLREILGTLREIYTTDVDIEFTVNLSPPDQFFINLVQCRPLQVRDVTNESVTIPVVAEEKKVLHMHHGVIGHSRVVSISRIVYVVPERYSALPERRQRALTAVIRRITSTDKCETILIGPGRWGTSTPSLGVPVSLEDIGNTGVLCEIDRLHESLVADMSLGTHFFNEMVERDLLYLSFQCSQKNNLLREEWLLQQPSLLSAYLHDDATLWDEVVRVIEYPGHLMLHADNRNQEVLLSFAVN